jgi:uncharacterized sporulation protein YeaH/YhbH (DUF444 family)
MTKDSTGTEHLAINGWYELFSRGSRDWLRHSEKIREAVREHLPQIVAGSDIINHGARHGARASAHARALSVSAARRRRGEGVGQGKAKPGDVLGQGKQETGPRQKGAGGMERGGTELMLEFKVDDIIDWLWEELKLPNLQPRAGHFGGSGLEA